MVLPLLPGQKLINGYSNFLFGSNISLDYASNNARNTPAIQAQFKAANFQVMRCAIPPTDFNNTPTTNAYIDLTANACAAMGCAMLVILNHNNVPWNQHLVSYLGNRCNLYEFGNEPDLYPITGQQYLAFWNQCIPVVRSINPNAAYIGPVLGVFANLQSFCTPWLQGCLTSGNLPDGFSYHVYPCTGDPSSTHCATRSTAFSSCYTQVDTFIKGILGHGLPQCMTEWNIDANAPPQNYTQDPNFAGPWVTQALNNMAQAGFAIACHWDAAGGAAGGQDDLISTQSPYPPQIEFAPMAAVIAQYLGGIGGGTGGGGGGTGGGGTGGGTGGGSSGGGGGSSSTLTFYMANAASSTLSSSDQLYTTSGSPLTNATYILIGNNVTGWGEIVAQGTSSAWAAAGSIGNPTGKGFLYDSTSLEMQQFLAGNWSPSIRLNASQYPTFTQAGTLVGDIVRRAFKRSSSGVYTQIVSSTLTAQTLTGTFATYVLPAVSTSIVTTFGAGDKLYLDQWFNCTQNANANANQGIRLNRLSTDATGFTGDPTTQMVTPGIQPTGGGGGGSGTIGTANPLGRATFGMARLGDLSMTATRGHALPLGLSYVISPSKYAKPFGVTYVIQKANVGVCLLYYLITPPSNFAINGDGTIIAPDQVTYTPRPVVGRSLLANPLLQGYSTMTWAYSVLQLSEYNHLLSFYNAQSPKVLLTFPDNTGTWVQRNANMLPPAYGLLETVQVTNVSLVFTGLFL